MFYDFRLVLDMALKLYTNVVKGLNFQVIKLWGLVLMFMDVFGEKLAGQLFCPHPE